MIKRHIIFETAPIFFGNSLIFITPASNFEAYEMLHGIVYS